MGIALHHFVLEVRAEAFSDYFLRRDVPAPAFLGVNNVVAETRLDQVGYLTGLQREGRGFERRHHPPAVKKLRPPLDALGPCEFRELGGLGALDT